MISLNTLDCCHRVNGGVNVSWLISVCSSTTGFVCNFFSSKCPPEDILYLRGSLDDYTLARQPTNSITTNTSPAPPSAQADLYSISRLKYVRPSQTLSPLQALVHFMHWCGRRAADNLDGSADCQVAGIDKHGDYRGWGHLIQVSMLMESSALWYYKWGKWRITGISCIFGCLLRLLITCYAIFKYPFSLSDFADLLDFRLNIAPFLLYS